jgi:hypothetical protein
MLQDRTRGSRDDHQKVDPSSGKLSGCHTPAAQGSPLHHMLRKIVLLLQLVIIVINPSGY